MNCTNTNPCDLCRVRRAMRPATLGPQDVDGDGRPVNPPEPSPDPAEPTAPAQGTFKVRALQDFDSEHGRELTCGNVYTARQHPKAWARDMYQIEIDDTGRFPWGGYYKRRFALVAEPDPVGRRCERGCGTPVNFGHSVCSPCLTKTLVETFRAQPCQGDGRKACENAAGSSGACAVHDPAIDETLGYIKQRSVAGLPVRVDPTLPPSVVEFRDESGRVLGTLTGVPGWGEARVERREIAVEPSGFRKNDAGKLPLDLLSRVPLAVVVEVGQAFDFGGRKYGFANYRKGAAWSRYSAAGLRHLLAWMRGEDNDTGEGGSGLSHLAHAIACLMILRELQLDNLGTDDRVVVK